jgi:ABC-type nickel/cobalt efflux system permease component RcnA
VKRIFLVFAAVLCLSTLSAGQQAPAPEASSNPSTQHASKHHRNRHHSKKHGGKHQHAARKPTS